MYSKCYPIITAHNTRQVAKEAPSQEKRCTLEHIDGNWYILTNHTPDVAKQYPLYIESFKYSTPHHLVESEKFNILYPDLSTITSTADKLRWYRYKHSLLQKDVALIIGVDRTTYSRYETNENDFYPIEHINKLSELYDVPITELLDDYNLFLYNDQGEQIRAIRQGLGLTQSAYAKMLGVPLGTLKKWEQNRVRIFKSTWDKYFK